MLSPLPRRSSWGLASLVSPSRISLPRKGDRVGLRIVLFEACSAFTRVTACTLAKSPFVTRCIEGFSHFVTSMTSPIASGRSICRVGLAPTGKRRLITAHTLSGHPTFSEADIAVNGSFPERQLSSVYANQALTQYCGRGGTPAHSLTLRGQR